jgi:diguanylate cyclase (GGDEF)-like protein/PAS domain S-box-containing protein
MNTEKTRLLLIEDDKVDQLAFRRLVEDQKLPYSCSIARSVAEARKILSEEHFDIVISDYTFGDGTAFEAVDFKKHAPVIMITGAGNEDIAATAMKKGAYDYLTKDTERNYLKVLPLIIENAIRRKRENEQLTLRSHALMSVNDSVYITDMKNRITYVNEMFCRTYGYKEKEIIGKQCDILWSRKETGLGVLKPAGQLNAVEYMDVRKDGSSFPVSLTRSYLKDHEGTDIAIVRVVRDITERKKAEDNLVHAKEEWEQTFDAIPDIIMVTDNNLRIVKANKALAERTGIRSEDLIGRFCYDVIHSAEGPPSYCPHHKTISTGKEHVEEIFEEQLKGHFLISTTPLIDTEGKAIGVVEVVRDITVRKKMENRLEEAAITDDLTGLLNRRGFYTLANQQCRMADRTKRGLSLLFVDLDRMKQINDELGHEAGDLALKDTADILIKTFRKSDIIARMGGDEFAVLITEPSRPGIEYVIMNHLKNNLAAHNEQGHRKYELSLSMGISNYNPDRPCSVSDLLTRADALMYEDKKRCRTGPSEGRGKERRAYERFSTGADYIAALDGTVKARIKDISMGGICLRTPTPMKINSTHKIHIISPDNEKIAPRGTVIWSSPTGLTIKKEINSHGTEGGVRFIRLSVKEKNALKNIIDNFTA